MKKVFVEVLSLLGLGARNSQKTMDFSHVTSQEMTVKLSQEGKLYKILLFPSEFGGQDIQPNVVYVPAGIAEIKEQITQTLIRFFQEGLINQLRVEPEYKGESFVPSKIRMKAWHSEKEGGDFEPTIDIW